MYRSKKLLKAVSELSCQHCGAECFTQAAHANWGIYGKGMGQKAHDCFVAALCIRCHAELDQGKNLSADERQQMWESAFRKTLLALFETGRLTCK